jgi:hypothetical protein
MRRRIEYLAFVPIIALLFFYSSTSGKDGLELFHKMQVAMGGAEKIAAARDFEQIGHGQAWDHEGHPLGTVTKRVRFIRPSYLRIDQVGPGDTYVLYFDGASGWEILPDKTVHDLAGGELKFAQGYLRGLDLNSLLVDREPGTAITSSAPNVLDITTKEEPDHTDEIVLDPETFLPSKTRSISLADPNHPVPNETLLADWRAVDGVKFATRITIFHAGKKLAEGTVDLTRLNSGLKVSDLAAKPPDLKPVMSGQ